MAQDNNNFYKRLTQLFRSGPSIQRRVKGQDYKAAYEKPMWQRNNGFRTPNGYGKESSSFSTIGGFGIVDRMQRYSTFAEMEHTGEIAAALDIFADETCATNEKGKSFHVHSNNREIKKALEDLFYDTMNIEFSLRPWVRNCTKAGDFFLYNEVLPDVGVINCLPLPVNEVEREEGYDPNDPSAVRFKWITRGSRILENWQVAHFRIMGNELYYPYGTSLLDPAIRIWRQVTMMEDSMLVYRVVRSGERRVFYIDVGNTAPNDIPSFMEAAKKALRSNTITEREEGRQDLRHNPVDVIDDYWIPTRGGESGTRIETLAGGQHVSATEDVEYLQKKLFSALKVPRAYLGYDESVGCFLPETKVSLLDGRDISIQDIKLELDSGKELWTYSCDVETKEIVPGKILNSWKTKTANKLVKVTLDNGESFTCTPEHKWLTRDGVYVEAQTLTTGSSLMPLHKRITGESTGKRNLMGYEQVYNPGTNKWEYTHSLVNRVCRKDNPGTSITNRRVVHHKDFNKLNNTPNNLVEMNFHDHRKLHQECLAETKRKALAEGKYSGLNNGWAQKCLKKIEHLYDLNNLISWCAINKPTAREDIFKLYGLSETWFNRLLKNNNTTYEAFAKENIVGGYKFYKKNVKLGATHCSSCCAEVKMSPSRIERQETWFCSKECKKVFANVKGSHNVTTYDGQNHQNQELTQGIILNHKVVSIEFLCETRDVWDIEVERYNNFALANGVIVHNSKSTLAQEDIRFSRTINILQKIFIAEFNKIAMLHLYAKGFDGEDLVNFELFLSNPSSVALQQKLALWNDRADIAGKFKETGLVDEKWIHTEILGFTDDEVNSIKAGRKEDILYQKELEKIAVSEDNQERVATTDPFDGSSYQVPGAEVERETNDVSPGISDKELVSGISKFDTEGNVLSLEVAPGKGPIAATPYATNRRRNDKRRVGQGGDFNLATPNFAKMLDQGGRNKETKTDFENLRLQTNEDVVSFSVRQKQIEDIEKELEMKRVLRTPTKPPYEVQKMFENFDKKFKINRNINKMILEGFDEKLEKGMQKFAEQQKDNKKKTKPVVLKEAPQTENTEDTLDSAIESLQEDITPASKVFNIDEALDNLDLDFDISPKTK